MKTPNQNPKTETQNTDFEFEYQFIMKSHETKELQKGTQENWFNPNMNFIKYTSYSENYNTIVTTETSEF